MVASTGPQGGGKGHSGQGQGAILSALLAVKKEVHDNFFAAYAAPKDSPAESKKPNPSIGGSARTVPSTSCRTSGKRSSAFATAMRLPKSWVSTVQAPSSSPRPSQSE